MFTTWDKAIAGLIMGFLFILTNLGVVVPEWASEIVITTVVGALTPILVYFVPNREA